MTYTIERVEKGYKITDKNGERVVTPSDLEADYTILLTKIKGIKDYQKKSNDRLNSLNEQKDDILSQLDDIAVLNIHYKLNQAFPNI